MTTMYIDFHLHSEKVNFDFSDLINCGKIGKNNIGDIGERSKKIIPYCNWCCITPEKHYLDTDKVMKDFYNEIKPNLKKIKARIKKFELEVYCCVVIKTEYNDDIYSLSISKEMIEFCAELGASLDFDLYLNIK